MKTGTFKVRLFVWVMIFIVTLVCYSINLSGTIQAISQTSANGEFVKTKFQSYNYPNMYIRHFDFDARIDKNVNPEEDSQWQLVKGLANQGDGYVSIQSVNYPDYYLKHSNYDLALEKNDGSSDFAAAATFKKVRRLSDSSCTSFQSYNYPTRYIRHYEKLLKLEEIVSDLDRMDASYRLFDDSVASIPTGPTILKKNGRIFMAFSASATDSNYCMGLLTASDTSDLLNPNS